MGPPPPWFFLALFPVMAGSLALVIRSVTQGVARIRAARAPALPAPEPEAAAQLRQLQAELDEMRGEVERLKAAESFYAQLQAGSGASR